MDKYNQFHIFSLIKKHDPKVTPHLINSTAEITLVIILMELLDYSGFAFATCNLGLYILIKPPLHSSLLPSLPTEIKQEADSPHTSRKHIVTISFVLYNQHISHKTIMESLDEYKLYWETNRYLHAEELDR